MEPIDILLINPPYQRRLGSGVLFPLGLGYLARAALNAGFRPAVLDCALQFQTVHPESLLLFGTWLREQIRTAAPKLAIGVGPCTTAAIPALPTISKACKEIWPEIPPIYGGPLASISGMQWMFFEELGAAATVPGDGEFVIQEVLRRLACKQSLEGVEGLVCHSSERVRPNVVGNLDEISFPVRTSVNGDSGYHLSVRRDLDEPPFAHTLVSRGCPNACHFCLSGRLREGQYHRKSVDSIVSEIKYLSTSSGVRSIVFYDDAFFPQATTLERDVLEFIEALKRSSINLIWQIEMSPEVALALDSRLAKALFRAGCRQINLGVESGSAHSARWLGKTVDHQELRRALIETMRGAPTMRIAGTFILGGPGETEESAQQTISYAQDLDLLFARFYPLEVTPGTRLFEMVFGEDEYRQWYRKVISDPRPWGHILFEQDGCDFVCLMNLVRKAYHAFYQRESWRRKSQRALGKLYPRVLREVQIWEEDRFASERGFD